MIAGRNVYNQELMNRGAHKLLVQSKNTETAVGRSLATLVVCPPYLFLLFGRYRNAKL